MKKLLEAMSIPRAVGTIGNNKIIQLLKELLSEYEYDIKIIPFKCKIWNTGDSYIDWMNEKQIIMASPYSKGFCGKAYTKIANTIEQLEMLNCEDSILFLCGEIVKEPLQPKEYPFYYPEEHRRMIELLERKNPYAIIAVTGKHPMCGLNPFPLFDDGNFHIPSGYMSIHDFIKIKEDIIDKYVSLNIASDCLETASEQIYAYKRVENSLGKIVICAHMDSKNNTLGALDNASGIVTLLKVAENLQLENYDVDIVPFNTEEYFGANGELLYLWDVQKNPDNIRLLVNIDSVGHVGSKIDVSLYNISEEWTFHIKEIINERNSVQLGQEWYAGDHCPFAFRGIPCITIASSDMWEGGLDQTHTMEDSVQNVDEKLLSDAKDFIMDLFVQLEIV